MTHFRGQPLTHTQAGDQLTLVVAIFLKQIMIAINDIKVQNQRAGSSSLLESTGMLFIMRQLHRSLLVLLFGIVVQWTALALLQMYCREG